MASLRKRTSKKTGNYSRRTTTTSNRGTTESYSFKPPGGRTRRTVSFNHKTGRMRTTYSTKIGGGWTKISSQSKTLSKKSKSTGRSRRKTNYDGEESGGITFIFVFYFIIFVIIGLYFW